MQENAGTRSLAAIVFTDVAGFSRIAGLNEPRALELLNRDFLLMRQSCERHTGKVVNVMGDGMLMLFPSAVEAMQCALEIQAEFHARASGQTEEVLHHRIGVHVGDVVMDGDNVYGDGVNVASRLQAEARPDAICFSRTVYDVIKNKVQVNATYLGPRSLKNIPERVMIWQALPLGDASHPTEADFALLSPPESGAIGAKGGVLIALSVVLLAVFVAGALMLGPKLAASGRPGQPLVKPAQPAPVQKPAQPKPQNPPIDTATEGSLNDLRQRYEFSKMVDLLQNAPPNSVEDSAGLLQRYAALAEMRKWLEQELAAANADSPIRANLDLGSGEMPCAVYSGPGGLTVDPGNNPELRTLSQLPPGSVYNLLSAVAQDPQAPSMVPQWMSVFAEEYGLGR
jgi:class 3 adenylate cyclase